MSSKTYLITGANRGLGLEYVKQISEESPDSIVIATTRDPSRSTDLQAISKSNPNVKIVLLDVSSQESILKLPAQISEITDTIDIFISNAAIANAFYPYFDADRETFLTHYATNVLGPIEITKAIHPFFAKSEIKQLIFITSAAGSLTGFIPISTSAYGQSKAALNHVILSFSNELKSEGFTVVAIHPGMVSTEGGWAAGQKLAKRYPEVMGPYLKDYLTPEKSVSTQLTLFKKFTQEDNGKFYDLDGNVLPY